ncbi:IS5 family transposase [Streptomyces sp. NPDC059396]|uniref:IS5 family transposase n=1 Tax=Streptomyces sp. NPDC059396 TaxID=3346819 RepID=UPI0036B9DBE9
MADVGEESCRFALAGGVVTAGGKLRVRTHGVAQTALGVEGVPVREHRLERGRGQQRGVPPAEPSHHAIGRSRGGLTTKIHLAGDSHCRPLCFCLTPGEANDAPAFEHVMAALRTPRAVGRPRTRPLVALADRAYSSRAIREHLRGRGIRAVIPERADQVANCRHKGRRGGRPPAFDREAYKRRNTVERCINRLKNWRGLATRYEKTATVFRAGLHIAGIFIWSAH